MRPTSLALLAALSLTVLSNALPEAALASDTLTLRINDSEGEPGDLATVEIRTYAPRTVGQGQICLQAGSSQASSNQGPSIVGAPAQEKDSEPVPWIELESFAVLSSEGDVISEGTFESVGQTTFLAFVSPSGTINADDGPMVVLFFRVAENAPPDTEFDVLFDVEDTSLIDSDGLELELELRGGRFKILKPTNKKQEKGEGGPSLP